ncbi:WHG domain-containing protein [Duganella sp. LX20W]|uniref:WHG domain-containing protein n=1 Tax=Rugamonas brunnea TaxID=2758569 RepID=A0A7W2EWV8_9BURK|nr:WHG domain-containing protein [Rugamonas brunnea]MBA5640097.1 WHG domain-containing protein [Rugamonas brunnea]
MTVDLSLQDPRTRLVEAAIRLLARSGPSEVKARSVATEAQLSTMGVYTYFGGVPELLQAVADDGFRQQASVFGRLALTDDPMADLCAMALACHDFARRNPHLYDLMFGLSIHGRYSPSRGDAEPILSGQSPSFRAAYTFLLQGCARLVTAKCVRNVDPDLMALQLWSALHGFIMLDLGGHFAHMANPVVEVLVPMCVNLVVGMGAKRDKAEASGAAAGALWSSAQNNKIVQLRNK